MSLALKSQIGLENKEVEKRKIKKQIAFIEEKSYTWISAKLLNMCIN